MAASPVIGHVEEGLALAVVAVAAGPQCALEGLGTRLVPHFRLIEYVTPYVTRLVAERWSPGRIAGRTSGAMRETGRALRALPRLVESLARRLGDGDAALRFEVPEVEVFGRHLERSVDRLVIGLVTAALIVGSSVLLSRAGTEGLSAAWLLGAVGIVISFANSIWLVASIHRSHRSRD